MRSARVIALVLAFGLLSSARSIDAATLKLAWDPSGDGRAAGYIVWVGTTSHIYTRSIDVGLVTSYEVSGLDEGVTYYLAVQTYDAQRALSDLSVEVRGTPSSSVNASPEVTITSPLNGAKFTPPATISLTVTATDSDGSVTRVEFFSGGASLGSDLAPPFAISWSDVPAGTYTITAVATDDRGATTTSSGVSVTVANASGGSSATFGSIDSVTRGNWIGIYGRDGYALAGDEVNVPSYAQLTISGAAVWTWAAPTADVRALQRASSSGRIAATAYNDVFSIDINLTDGLSHQVALYSVDWENAGRVQRIDVRDAATGALLDSRTMADFAGGQYLIWTLRGHVRLELRRLAGVNAVVSGLFFDPTSGSSVLQTSAKFVSSDTTTQGTWLGVYGSGGYGIAGDVVAFPAYAQLAVKDAAYWMWAASTSDIRALQRADGSGRIAATIYGASFDVELTLTDGQRHKITLYSVDWENLGRVQQVEMIDAATGAVLDARTLSSFAGGAYLAWNVTGHIIVRVTNKGPVNAVVSALFFE